jgi:hypothetical protein
VILLIFVLVFAELALLATYVSVRRREKSGPRWWLHEVVLLAQTLYWIGAATLVVTDATDQMMRFVLIACMAQLSATAGGIAAISGHFMPAEAGALSDVERWLAYVCALVSGAACLTFVLAVVLNQDLGPILLGVIAGDEEFVAYRMIMSTGRAIYLAPGYVKQFRDVLLPGAFLVLMIGTRNTPRLLMAFMWILGFIAAVLSGERSVLMIHVFVLGVGLVLKQGRSERARRGIVIVTVALGVAAFVGFTILLGRTTIGATFFGAIGEAFWGLFERVSLVVPTENAESFAVWGAVAPTWGKSWASELLGILPGVQTSFSNDLHTVLGGSPLGNSTLGLAADTFLAWGIVGVLVVPFTYMVLLARLDRFLLSSSLLSARIARIIFAPLTVQWFSPFLFILNGGMVLMVSALIARRFPARDATN